MTKSLVDITTARSSSSGYIPASPGKEMNIAKEPYPKFAPEPPALGICHHSTVHQNAKVLGLLEEEETSYFKSHVLSILQSACNKNQRHYDMHRA